MAQAFDGAASILGFRERRQKQSRQDRNDPNNHDQFNQRKTFRGEMPKRALLTAHNMHTTSCSLSLMNLAQKLTFAFSSALLPKAVFIPEPEFQRISLVFNEMRAFPRLWLVVGRGNFPHQLGRNHPPKNQPRLSETAAIL
jgi:hypothetical protein